MRVVASSFLAVAAMLLIGAGSASAAHRHHHAGRYVAPARSVPTADAVELGSLAPPTRLTTLEQTYGDAAIARAQIRNANRMLEQRAEANGAAPGVGPFPCDPRIATTGGELCRSPAGRVGYGEFDAFTPAYVSAPTTVAQDPAVQAPVMPAVTSLFYGFDRLVSGARD